MQAPAAHVGWGVALQGWGDHRCVHSCVHVKNQELHVMNCTEFKGVCINTFKAHSQPGGALGPNLKLVPHLSTLLSKHKYSTAHKEAALRKSFNFQSVFHTFLPQSLIHK